MPAFIPVSLAPVATFAIFAAKTQNEVGLALSSTRIFTTLSLLSLITQPLDLLFAYVPEILAAVACFSRIEDYLYKSGQHSALNRLGPGAKSPTSLRATTNASSLDSDSDEKTEKVLQDGLSIELRKATFGWSFDADPVLSSIDMRIPFGKLTMVTGPIAAGKSTLLKGILGETAVSKGNVEVSSRSISFCDQNPWLANETLQSNILGSNHFDAQWYAEVVRACALEKDICQFPEGDQVNVGGNGLSLSGGQKQRVVSPP